MAQAAGVCKIMKIHEVADKTNWSNLTDYLGIERGVNDPRCKLT